LVGRDGGHSVAGSSRGSSGCLARQCEERLPRRVASHLVGVRDVAIGGEVQVSAFQRVTSNTAKDRVGRCEDLKDIVRASRSLLETSQVIGVHDVHLGVLAHRDTDPADRRGLEGRTIEQRQSRRSQLLISSVQVDIVVWLEIVREADLSRRRDGKIGSAFVQSVHRESTTGWDVAVGVALTVTRDSKDTGCIRCQAKTTLPDTSLACTVFRGDNEALGGGGAGEDFHGEHANETDARSLADRGDDARVVEHVAVATKGSDHDPVERSQRGPLENRSCNEKSFGSIVGRPLHRDGESRCVR
jgi:hypothetical protein